MNRTMFALCVSALVGLFCLPQAQADGRRLIIATNAPVEIPGRVLNPGVYELQYLDDSNGLAIVRVWDHDSRQDYGWYMVEPVERVRATNSAEVDLEEPMANSPERIREWFFPGEKEGHEFVYRARARHGMASLKAGGQPIVEVRAVDVDPYTSFAWSTGRNIPRQVR